MKDTKILKKINFKLDRIWPNFLTEQIRNLRSRADRLVVPKSHSNTSTASTQIPQSLSPLMEIREFPAVTSWATNPPTSVTRRKDNKKELNLWDIRYL